MDAEAASSGRRPAWWQILIPRRWRPEAPAPTSFGPASAFAVQQVEQRLRDPQWDTTGHNQAPAPRGEFLDNRPPFPPGGHGAKAANQRPYPA